jgi:hypothetical protein
LEFALALSFDVVEVALLLGGRDHSLAMVEQFPGVADDPGQPAAGRRQNQQRQDLHFARLEKFSLEFPLLVSLGFLGRAKRRLEPLRLPHVVRQLRFENFRFFARRLGRRGRGLRQGRVKGRLERANFLVSGNFARHEDCASLGELRLEGLRGRGQLGDLRLLRLDFGEEALELR